MARILHIISSVDPQGGGPIEGINQIATALRPLGHEIEIASCDAPDASFLAGFPLVVNALGPGRGKYRYTPKLVPWLIEHGREFDWIVANGIWQYSSFATRVAMRKLGKPYVVFTHGMLDPWFKQAYPLKHLKKLIYWPWGEYRVLRDAAAVMFTCEEERNLARKSFRMYRANERVIHYGTAGPSGDRETQLSSFFKNFPDLNGKRILLYLSRIHPKKGCDLLIQAFAAVGDPAWRLVMAGPDQVGWRSELQSLASSLGIADRIVWPGMLAGDMKWGAFHACEAFVLPSHQENFGIVVAEALACGKPVLISNKVNIWREIEQDRAGLVAQDTLAGTQSLLERWASMPAVDQAALTARARPCFMDRFEIGQAAQSFVKVLEEVEG